MSVKKFFLVKFKLVTLFWIFFSLSYFCYSKDLNAALKFNKSPSLLTYCPLKCPVCIKNFFSVLFLCFWLQWSEIWHVSALRYYKWKQSKFLKKFKCQMSVKKFFLVKFKLVTLFWIFFFRYRISAILRTSTTL